MNQDVNEKGITKAEMVELLTSFKADMRTEMFDMFTVSRKETNDLFVISRAETADLMDKVISVIDARIDSSIDSLKQELKAEIRDLRNDMNQRFLIVDNRLLSIETNMVRQEEFKPLVKRVEKFELAGV